KETGLSIGAVYTHFESKDDILLALCQRSVQRRREKFDFADAAALRRFFVQTAESVATDSAKEGFRADLEIISASAHDKRRAKVLEPFRVSHALTDALKVLKKAGHLRKEVDPEAAAMALDALLYGSRLLAFIGGGSAEKYRAAMSLLVDRII